jgi:hypothetical protein
LPNPTIEPRPPAVEIVCISLMQPWATLAVYGPKWCENRSWRTPYRGPLYVHASTWDRSFGPRPPQSGPEAWRYPLPERAVIGRADLRGCWDMADVEACRGGFKSGDDALNAVLRELSRDPRNFFGWDHVCGPVCWLLADRRPLAEPIPMPGNRRLWMADVPAACLRFADPIAADA